MNRIDLHTHSTKSDGSYSPTELVEYALEKNLSAIALTDHDTVEGLGEAILAAKGKPIEIVSGIELSTECLGKDIHILGLDIDYLSTDFNIQILKFQDSRMIRNKKMCLLLQEKGFDISLEKLTACFPDSVITRSHYAEYLLNHNYIKSKAEAFERYIGDYGPCFVSREKVTPTHAIQLILNAGGIPILAHPVLYHLGATRLNELISTLVAAGLMGIEAVYSSHNAAEESNIRKLALKYNIQISGGSDFHGLAKPKIDLGTGYGSLFVPEDILTNLRTQKEKQRL